MTEADGATIAEEPLARTAQPSFWGSFTSADARLLVVTFAGTVAANVMTVLVVALAVILARSNSFSMQAGALLLDMVWLVLVGLPAALIVVIVSHRRRRGARMDRTMKIGLMLAGFGLLPWAGLLLLVLVGKSAGIR